MRKCIWKPVNYEKVKEVTHEEEKTHSLSGTACGRLLENLLTETSPLPRVNPYWDNTLPASLPLILGKNSKSYN